MSELTREDVRARKIQAIKLLASDPELSAEDVAESTGLTVQQVRQAVSQSATVFQAQLADAKELGAMREMKRIAWVEAQAMEAWPRSSTERQPAGDPRLLKTVLECSDRRASLLGLIPKDKGGTSGAIDAESAIAAVTRAIIKHLAPTQFKTKVIDAAETIRLARAIETDLRAAFGLNGEAEILDAADFVTESDPET